MSERKQRKTIVGTVSSRSGEKSVKVTYDYKIRHHLYKKEIKQKTVIHAHDEENACAVGDRVSIMETRPMSKLKRFRVVEVLQKAPAIS